MKFAVAITVVTLLGASAAPPRPQPIVEPEVFDMSRLDPIERAAYLEKWLASLPFYCALPRHGEESPIVFENLQRLPRHEPNPPPAPPK